MTLSPPGSTRTTGGRSFALTFEDAGADAGAVTLLPCSG
jgi:hypothetical protein